MNIIKEEKINEKIINKSKFICIIKYIESIDDINCIINKIKNEYKNATHYCYSYIVGNNIKYYDDGEPTGSAGLPIYNALKNYDLNNVICIVVRYFGGIKLGIGPLTRAYFNTTNETLKISNIIKYIETKKIKILFNYEEESKINYIVKDYIFQKHYDENVEYVLNIPINVYDNLIENLSNYKIKKNDKF